MTTVQRLEILLKCPVDQWHTLTEIKLACANLITLRKEVGQWTSALTIFLNNNRLESLPKEAGGWISAERIYLNKNSIKTLPPEAGKWISAIEINLHQNELISVPPYNIVKHCYGINDRFVIKGLLQDINNKQNKINNLEEENEKLKEEVIDLTYRPGGIGYDVAKEDFNMRC